jgi:hypothetical protein
MVKYRKYVRKEGRDKKKRRAADHKDRFREILYTKTTKVAAGRMNPILFNSKRKNNGNMYNTIHYTHSTAQL